MINSKKTFKTVQIVILAACRAARAFGLSAPSAMLLVATCVLGLGMVSCALPVNGTGPDDSTATQAMPGAPMPQDSDYVDMPKGPDGWSANGQLLTVNYTKSINLQAQFGEPGDYTAEFAFSPTLDSQGFARMQAEALITWAIEGNFVTRRISVTNGASITGVAQAVRIQIFDVSNPGATPANIAYGVSVQVTKGARATTMQPPTLIPHPFVNDQAVNPVTQPYAQGSYLIAPEGGAGAGNSDGFTIIPVPPDAGVISIFVTVGFGVGPLGNPPAGYQAQGTAPVIPDDMLSVLPFGGADSAQYDPRKYPTWVPIVPGTQRVQLMNAMPPGGTNPTVQFFVAFGIDG